MRDKVMSKNAFVKKEQDVLKSMMGDRPKMAPDLKRFNATMSNDGAAAEKMCNKLTSGIDKKAFPVS